MNQDEKEDDPNSPAFLLQNLNIAVTDCFADSSHNGAARHAAAKIISSQIAFYVACLLRGFESRPIPVPPVILVVGAGFIGTSVIELLMAHELTSFLHVFCRGDLSAQQWRRRGLKSSPSMTRLMKDSSKADIVILCPGLSAFTNTSKMLHHHITPATCIITSSFGLQRKRIHASLHTLGVFRTYIEPQALVKHVKGTARAAGIDHSSFDDAGLAVTEKEATAEQDDEDDASWDDATKESTILDSIKTYSSCEQFLYLSGSAAGSMENAADLLASRIPDIRNIIYVLENYFSLLGLKHVVCRAQALCAVLGYVEDTAVGLAHVQLPTATLGSSSIENLMRMQGNGEDEDDDTAERNAKQEASRRLTRSIQTLAAARASLEAAVSPHFQRQLSKHIRVVDIPKLADYVVYEEKKSRRSTIKTRDKDKSLEGAAPIDVIGDSGQSQLSLEGGKNSSQPYAPPVAPAPQKYGPLGTMHPDKKILHIFSLDTRFLSPITDQYDDESTMYESEHDHESMLGFALLDDFLSEGGLHHDFMNDEDDGDHEIEIDATVQLGQEIAAAAKHF